MKKIIFTVPLAIALVISGTFAMENRDRHQNPGVPIINVTINYPGYNAPSQQTDVSSKPSTAPVVSPTPEVSKLPWREITVPKLNDLYKKNNGKELEKGFVLPAGTRFNMSDIDWTGLDLNKIPDLFAVCSKGRNLSQVETHDFPRDVAVDIFKQYGYADSDMSTSVTAGMAFRAFGRAVFRVANVYNGPYTQTQLRSWGYNTKLIAKDELDSLDE